MQKKEQRDAKEPGFSRNNPDDTQSHSDKQKRDNSEDKVLFHYNYKCYKIYKIHKSPEVCPTS
jgi:hypothetical protein